MELKKKNPSELKPDVYAHAGFCKPDKKKGKVNGRTGMETNT